jgi:hypothetical protein
MKTLAERIAEDGITAKAVPGPVSFPDAMPGSHGWVVTLVCQGRTMAVPFTTGPAVPGVPTAEDVLECLLLDVSGYENARDFRDWASEYGLEPDSTNRAIYREIGRQRGQLQAFLGAQYRPYLWETDR